MAAVAFTDTDVSTSTSTSFSFTSTIGAGDGARTIFALITGRSNNTTPIAISSVTIGGAAATEVVQNSISPGNTSLAGVFKADASAMGDPNATSVTVAITFSSTVNRGASCSVAVTADAIQATAYDTAAGSDPTNGSLAPLVVGLNLDVASAGFVLGVVSYYAEAGSTTWIGLTEEHDASIGTLSQYSTALLSAAIIESGRVITATHNRAPSVDHGEACGVAVSFAPASAVTEAAASSAGSATATATGLALADAAGSAVGSATSSAEGAATAEAAGSAAGTAIATAEGAGGNPDEVAPEEPAEAIPGGGGAYGHPDMDGVRKKKKKPPADAPDMAAEASRRAEADFTVLWEAVKIRNDPARRSAAEKKRIAMLLDLEKAAMVRSPSR